MPKSLINQWYNRKAGDFGETKVSSRNPNNRRGAIFPWVPVVNYKRVTLTDGEYKVREYSHGGDIWRDCANSELHRYSRERADTDNARKKNKRIIEAALKSKYAGDSE